MPSLREAIRLEPRLPLAHRKLGEALAALGRGREADAAFEEYFEQDADKGKVAVALEHLRSGRKAEAIETLREALRESPDNVDAMRCLAQIVRHATRSTSATPRRCCARRRRSRPTMPPAWMLLGGVLHETGRHRRIRRRLPARHRHRAEQCCRLDRLGNAYSLCGRRRAEPRRLRSAPSRWIRGSRRPDGARPRAQDAGRPGRRAARLPCGHRAQSRTSARSTGAWRT